jgi:hypothetical protein
MDDAAGQPPRRTFLIEAHPHHDLLLRVLGPFAVQGVEILKVDADQNPARITIRIEAGGMAPEAASLLADRLRAMPAVTGVGLGWRVEMSHLSI